MKPAVLYPVLVGVLIFLVLIGLDALHIGENSLWRAGLVGGLCSMVVYWLGPKLTGRPNR